jgi:preprotein translocase subunit SecY
VSLEWGSALSTILYVIMIIAFAYFYTAVQFDPFQVAGNIKKYGGFIPGLRPGKPTADYLGKVTNRLTTVGAISLAFIAVFPMILQGATGMSVIFTGTGLIIVVGVVLETVKQIESHMLIRSYKGFMK